MAIIRPPVSGDSPQDSWANQVTEAINKGLFAPSVNPSDGTALISVNGNSSATLYLYVRTTTASAPTAVDEVINYNYRTASFEGDLTYGTANWTPSPPTVTNGNYLWTCVVNVSANVDREVIQANAWSTPQILSVNGSSSKTIDCFIRKSGSAPGTPTGGSYNFSNNTLAVPTGNPSSETWSATFPEASVGDTTPAYISTAIATVVGSNGTDTSLNWSTPVKMSINGANGLTGASTNIIFKRSANQPSTPNASSSIPSGWYDDASSATGTDLLWAASGFKSISSSTFTWSTPFRIEGESIAEVAVYRLNNNTGLTGSTYNFVTNTLTPPSNWSTSAPSLSNNGDIVYRASGVVSGSAKETAASVTFGSAVIFARQTDGTDGTDANDIAEGLIYYTQASANNPGTPSASDYNFSNGAFTNLTSGWQVTPVQVVISTTTLFFWSARFRAVKAPGASTATVTFNTPIPSVNFGTNIQSDNYVSGSSGWQIQRNSGNAEFNNVDIRGGAVASSVVVGGPVIYSTPPTTGNGGVATSNATGMFLNSVHNRIEVWDSGTLRVILGGLSNLP